MANETLEQRINAMFENVLTVAEQVRAANSVTDTYRLLAKQLEKLSVVLADNAESISESVAVEQSNVYAIANTLGEWSDVIGPKSASVMWRDEDIQKEIKALLALDALGGVLTSDQSTILAGIATDMTKGSGVRGPRGKAEIIEGAPSRVYLINAKGERIGNLSGNTANSAGNIALKLANVFGVDTKSESHKVLRELARRAVNGDIVTVGEGENMVTLTPVMVEED